jgi:hypothetical protein
MRSPRCWSSPAGLPLCRSAHRHALFLCDLRARLHRAPDRLADLPVDRSQPRARHQADHRAVPARRLDHGDGLPARLYDRIGALVGDPARRCSVSARASRWAAPGTACRRCSRSTPRQNRRGWYAMIPQLGAPLGLIVASALFAFFLSTLSRRLPRLGLALSLLRRLRDQRGRAVRAAPHRRDAEFERLFESRELQPSRVIATVRSAMAHDRLGAFAPLASFALFHMVTVFPLSWVFLFTPQNRRALPADRDHRRGRRRARDDRCRA